MTHKHIFTSQNNFDLGRGRSIRRLERALDKYQEVKKDEDLPLGNHLESQSISGEEMVIKGKMPDGADNQLPDTLDFVEQGTISISVPEGKFAEFCPHLHYCSKQDIDSNCFYIKFLGCLEARILEKTHQLNPIDKFYLRYENVR